jgi:uncharacterized protein (TIGR03435 family)
MAPERGSLEMTREFLIGLAMFAPALWGQTAARTEFEVASVKVNASGSPESQANPEHGNFTCENMPLKWLIGFAYDLPWSRVSGPGWMDSARFDINAKGKGDAPDSEVRLMLQALLEDRFHIQAHREMKEGPVYFLTVTNGGLKADRADAEPRKYPALPPGPHAAIQMRRASMAQLAAGLTNPAGRPVLDRTGIEGVYQVRVWWGNNPETDAPDLFTALREQVGLKLESGRGPVETLVVDAADKVPTEN